jgi:GxxExxY protein
MGEGSLQKTTESKGYPKREFLHGDLTYKINGILIETFKELGKYAKEKHYANLIEVKLKKDGISYKRELRIGDSENIVDFIVEDKVIIELKAKPFLTKHDYDQIKRYLYQTGLRLGILVNFRTDFINPKRVLNENYR